MYVVVSPRVGTPGEPFEPAEGVNVQALLDAGFIAEKNAPKRARTEQEPDKE